MAAAGASLLTLTAVVGPAAAQAQKTIGATGTIEPRGGVVMITGVPGATIVSIQVRVGQAVKKGDVLMALADKEPRLAANLDEIAVEQARRHSRQAVADEALALTLAEDRARRAEQEATAYRNLGPDATSQHQMATVEASADEARGALAIERRKSAQVRADAVSDTSSASARYDLSRARLAAYRVVAPSAGVVLDITQHAGEALSGAPAIEIGDISAMYVTCNAFQGDLLKIAPGMRATVSSNAFSNALTGQVEWVGRLVQTKSQTGQFKVKLDDAALASRLVGMEVNVKVMH
jgi:HlyD family secretion protein